MTETTEIPGQEAPPSTQVVHTSVVYFHGMGNQRRYEEVSGLVDSLDIHAENCSRKKGIKKGSLSKIRPRLEGSRSVPDGRETYIRAYLINKDSQGERTSKTARFYEVYWAPIMAQSVSIREVLLWMFSTVFRPIRTILSPWRERQRLRRAVLLEMEDSGVTTGAKFLEGDVKKLLQIYDAFERPDILSKFPNGSFNDYREWIKIKWSNKPAAAKRLVQLANFWYRRYLFTELKNLFFLFTLALMILIGVVLSASLVLLVLQSLGDIGIAEYFHEKGMEALAKSLEPNLQNSVVLLFGLFSIVGIGNFLKTYLGDVHQWTTYEETDEKHAKRREVIERGVATLSHVLMDPACERVVVVSHSLGTAIAQDTILA
jgi:hypothetical protein